jgi:hypothetical protein
MFANETNCLRCSNRKRTKRKPHSSCEEREAGVVRVEWVHDEINHRTHPGAHKGPANVHDNSCWGKHADVQQNDSTTETSVTKGPRLPKNPS